MIPQAPAPIDPDDPNNQRTSLPEHEPILGAYRRAVEGELLTYSRWPLDPESPELVNGPFTARVMEPIRQGIADRTALNQVLDIDDGITLCPYVIEDDDGDPNGVFVWDCQIDTTFWKEVDTGEKAPPDAFPNVGPPGVETGVVAVMDRMSGNAVPLAIVRSGGIMRLLVLGHPRDGIDDRHRASTVEAEQSGAYPKY